MSGPIPLPFSWGSLRTLPPFYPMTPMIPKLPLLKSGRKGRSMPRPLKRSINGRKGNSLKPHHYRQRVLKKGYTKFTVKARKGGAKRKRGRKGAKKGKRKTTKARKGRRKPKAVFKASVYRVKRGRKGFFPLLALIPAAIAAAKAAAAAAALGAAGAAGKLAVDKIAGKSGRTRTANTIYTAHKGALNQSVMQHILPGLVDGLKKSLTDGVATLGSRAITSGGTALFRKLFSKKKAGRLSKHWKNHVQRAAKGDLDSSAFDAFGDILALEPDEFSKTFQNETKKSFLSRLLSGAGKILTKKATKEIGEKVLDKALDKINNSIDSHLSTQLTITDPVRREATRNALINNTFLEPPNSRPGMGLTGLTFNPAPFV